MEYILSVFVALLGEIVGVPLKIRFRETDDICKRVVHLVNVRMIFETFVIVTNSIWILKD